MLVAREDQTLYCHLRGAFSELVAEEIPALTAVLNASTAPSGDVFFRTLERLQRPVSRLHQRLIRRTRHPS